MLVQVTAEHVKRGIRGSYSGCPIALAVRDLGYEYVSARWSVCRVSKALPKIIEYDMPREARVFVEHFDSGKPVQPIQFIMEEM